jgi:hypothetical protein
MVIESSHAVLFVVGSRGHVADPLSVQVPDFLGTQGPAELGELVHMAAQVPNGNGDHQAIADDPEFLTQNRKSAGTRVDPKNRKHADSVDG